ncbi:MAG: cation:proton antiporter [Solirubrobacterales bacterium]
MNLAAISLHAPEGGAWEFLVLFIVVILGPPIVQKAKVPGLIGLLIGGFLIGPNGFGFLDSGSTTIPDLGQLGLLYLMFIAGVELNLGLLRRHRRSAISFGLLTFSFPMAFGTAVGLIVGWELPASLLLGSLLASHTLLLYPLAKDAGLSDDPVVASVVGATVLTDTIALVILAVIAGTQSGTGTGTDVVLQLALGFLALGLVCFVALPFLARRAFRLLGSERTVRYAIAVASFLIAAVVAETFGIEGIVGAFFAGLAMNRLVPNEGPLMKRIDFFGGAVFIPVFLVSVGLLLKPAVMFQGETLGLAALFILACLGGKFIAAELTRLLMGATAHQARMAFALSTPQAAATLAATTVGFEIGLFGESVVNAVLVLILVSVLVATIVAEREKSRIAVPDEIKKNLGERVLVAIVGLSSAPLGLRIARAISETESGVVRIVLLVPTNMGNRARQSLLDQLNGTCRRLGIDADPEIAVTDHPSRSTILEANGFDSSLVLAVGDMNDEPWRDLVSLSAPSPVAIVQGTIDKPIPKSDVVIARSDHDASNALAARIDSAIAKTDITPVDQDAGQVYGALTSGQIAILPVSEWQDLPQLDPVEDSGVVLIPTGLLPST